MDWLVFSIHIFLQAAQTLLGKIEDVIVLAHREPKIVFGKMGIFHTIEVRRWDGCNTKLLD